MRKWRIRGLTGLLALSLALALGMAGCSSANDKAESKSSESVTATKADEAVSNAAAASQSGATAKEASTGEAADSSKTPGAAAVSAGSGSATAGLTGSAAAQPEGLNRKLIYKANLAMTVDDYGKAQSAIRDLVTLAGGYILQFSETNTTHEQGGTFVLKVPSSGFSSFLKDLEQIPNRSLQRSMHAQDVSEEYVDLESRLKALQILESRYLDFMQKATKTEDLIKFTNELGKIQEDIEKIKGRMRYIDQNVAFSTIEIRVHQPVGKNGGLAHENQGDQNAIERAGAAMRASFGFLSEFGQGLLVLAAALLPVLAVAAVIGTPVWIYFRRSVAKRREQQEREKGRRLEHNRMLAGMDVTRQDTGESDKERRQDAEKE